jgi:hypothetical protein
MLGRLIAVASVVLAMGLIAAGCGDDDDETTSATTTTAAGATGATGATGAATGEPLSKDEFIAAGDEICKPANEELRGQQSPEDVTENIRRQIDGLRSLTPPEGDEEEITQILDDAQAAIDEIQETESFGGGAGKRLNEAGEALQDYGFKECGAG